MSQDGSKLAPRAPQEPQEAPKTSHRDPQTAFKNHNYSLDLVPIFKQPASKQSRAKQASKQASKQDSTTKIQREMLQMPRHGGGEALAPLDIPDMAQAGMGE